MKPIDYTSYITSSAWRSNPSRLAELRASGHRCRICNVDQDLEVHHRTYERLGQELASDLTTLCYGCHRVVTNHLRQLRYDRVVPKVRDTIHTPSSPLFDPSVEEFAR